MYVVIFDAAHEHLRNIVAHISNENPKAAETLGRELLDEAMSLESLRIEVREQKNAGVF